MNATWTEILSHLQKHLPEGVFKVWLEPLKGEVIQVGSPGDGQQPHWEIRLTAQNDFVCAWVRDRLCQPIIQAGAELLGQVPVVQVTSSRDKAVDPFPAVAKPEEVVQALPSAPAVLASTSQLSLPVDMAPIERTSSLKLQALRHSFEDFVVGPCNQLAHAAASNILRTTTPVDMLFLCSGSGLGKTHLTQAVGKALSVEADRTNTRIGYLTAEEFTSQFVLASRYGNMEQFKERFRSLDMLLLEDVHFLRGKDKTQEELLATINSLQARGGKVVLTSSFAPRELSGVDSQLVSRFCSGFVATMERPGLETRFNILMEKARRQTVVLPQAIAELLAERVTSDVRLLESCLHNLVLKSQLLGRPMSEEMAVEVLNTVAMQNPGLSLEAVLELVCRSFNLTRHQLTSRSRKQNLVDARNTAFFLLRKHTELTLEEIGQHFNRRHSTVLKGISQLESEISRQTPRGRQYKSALTMIEKNALRV